MTIKVGDTLPDATVREFIEVEGNGCSVGPNKFQVADLVRGKRIVVFGLPGAYTPTCSASHVPGYLAHYEQLKARGVDEIWCVSVNDAFVMGAWWRSLRSSRSVARRRTPRSFGRSPRATTCSSCLLYTSPSPRD